MARVLTVLVGAGASYDCADDDTCHRNMEYRPPLVKDLFANSRVFANLLSEYPQAEAVAEQVRGYLRNPNAQFELLLRAVFDDENLYIRKQSRQVPLYLQHLLGVVSERYVSAGVTRFLPLVNTIARSIGERYDRVVYLTLNYDLFLERELSRTYHHTFNAMRDYIFHPTWALIKLHGSVNWGAPLYPSTEHRLAEQLERLWQEEREPSDLAGPVEVLSGHHVRNVNDRFMYPALAVPLAGKSGFVCPPEHIELAQAAVSQSKDFLVIGCRIADQDVIDLFKLVKHVRALCVVSGSDEESKQIIEHLISNNEAFVDSREIPVCRHAGFCDFISSRMLERFLMRRV